MKPIAIGILAAMLAAGAQKNDEAERLLKAAQNTEMVDGKLDAAIKQYRAIVSKYAKSDRAVAATALLQIGECYRKMGDTQARKVFEEVVSDYADQKEAVATARARLGRTAAANGPVLKTAWSRAKADYMGRVSADGRYVSYCDGDTGALMLHDFQTDKERVLVPDPKHRQWDDEYFDSAISRDSKLVVYSWETEGDADDELRIVNLNGDPNPRRLFSSPDVDWLRPYDWSPDGKWVAVEVDMKRMGQIGVVSVADGSLHILRSGAQPEGLMFFSPDSKYLAYGIADHDRSKVYVQGIDGGGEVAVADNGGENVIMGWSPDGKLLYASDRSGGMSLWEQALVNGKPQGGPRLVNAEIGGHDSLGVSDTGTLYFQVLPPRRGLHVQTATLDPISGKLLVPGRDLEQAAEGYTAQANWSPDGKYLSYYSSKGRPGAKPVIVIRPADSDQPIRELKMPLQPGTAYFWSGDSSSLQIVGTDSNGKNGSWRIDAATGEISMLVGLEKGVAVKWSPDAKTLYFRRKLGVDQGSAIFVRDVTSGVEKELIRAEDLGTMNVSPDGRYIASSSSSRSARSLTMLLIPTAGGEPREVLRKPATGETGKWPPAREGFEFLGWAADSRTFLVRSHPVDEKQSDEVWRVSVDGAAPRKLDLTPDFAPRGNFSLHPDGRRIAYSAPPEKGPEAPTEVRILENFLPGFVKK